MTLLFLDSFDHYSIPADLPKKYENTVTSNFTAVAGRTNNCAQTNSGVAFFAKTVGEISNYIIFGFGWYGVGGLNAQSLVAIADRLIPNIDIYRNSDSTITVRRHSGASAATAIVTSVAAPLSLDAWHYVEVKAKKGSADGEVIVNVDGLEVINSTGLNTSAFQDNGAWTAVVWCCSAASNGYAGNGVGTKRIDDIYICDDTGTRNNTILNQPSVYVIYPVSDASLNEWTPDSGTDHFARVDETDLDDDTSYLEDTSTDDEEMFGFQDSPVAVGSVAGIQVNTAVRKTTPGGATYYHRLRQAITVQGTNEQGFPSGSVYNVNTEPYDADPTDNVDWTFAKVNSLVAGVKRNA